jgi:hypothetical protein
MAKVFQSIPLSTPANADFNGESIDLDTLPISYINSSIGTQFFYSGLSGVNANIVIQVSNDGVNFNTGSRVAVNPGFFYTSLDLKFRYCRVIFEKGTNATGTISAISYVK